MQQWTDAGLKAARWIFGIALIAIFVAMASWYVVNSNYPCWGTYRDLSCTPGYYTITVMGVIGMFVCYAMYEYCRRMIAKRTKK